MDSGKDKDQVKLPNGRIVEVSDYDPENGEVFYTRQGEPITEELAARWQEELENDDSLIERAKKVTYPRRGRPSLSKPGVTSPQIRFRVPADVRSKADKVAAREGKTVSQLARELLEQYLQRKPA